MLRGLLLAAATAAAVIAQDTTTTTSASTTSSVRTTRSQSNTIAPISVSISGSIITNASVSVPTGSYEIPPLTQESAVTTLTSSVTGLNTRNSSSSSSGSNSLNIVGQSMTPTANGTATATSSTATPSNTQACNNYEEFCDRQYSNITQVAAHNAAMVRKDNAFSNQRVEILGQLNDGIRMIQGEVHYENETLYNCHSDCSLLNTGPYLDTLVTIREWLDENPFEVVTLLIVNSGYHNVTVFDPAFQESGILKHIYLPEFRPMRVPDWPTLGDMILQGTRLVVFMDYQANNQLVPYILDEFSNMWETPFSPTDPDFPCTQQRPPGLSDNNARNQYLYMANHNLNVQLSISGMDALIPNFATLNLVNANNDSDASLLTMSQDCVQRWDRPPNFLLVDFYDESNSLGGVFEVQAAMNGVTYNRACCGTETGLRSQATELLKANWHILSVAAAAVMAVLAFVV